MGKKKEGGKEVKKQSKNKKQKTKNTLRNKWI